MNKNKPLTTQERLELVRIKKAKESASQTNAQLAPAKTKSAVQKSKKVLSRAAMARQEQERLEVAKTKVEKVAEGIAKQNMTAAKLESVQRNLDAWMSDQGLAVGVLGYDHSDPLPGEQQAVFDLAWPNGIQEELSQPVAVLLNEDLKTIALASEAGFHSFTSVEAFKLR